MKQEFGDEGRMIDWDGRSDLPQFDADLIDNLSV